MDDAGPSVSAVLQSSLAAAQGLDVPVTCKIRVFTDLQKTLDYAKMLQRAGCSVLAVHGRTREQKDAKSVRADWEIIKVGTCSSSYGHGQVSRAVMLHVCLSQLKPKLWPWTCQHTMHAASLLILDRLDAAACSGRRFRP